MHSENQARAARPVLVVAHPGHELRVYGWLTKTRPVVHVLTDGSGSDGEPRIASTTTLLEQAGATPGSIYGRLSDREIYAAIIAGDHARFISLAQELASVLVREDVEIVAGDAVEGFNPSHDVCRYVINAAVRLAAEARNRPIACYAFPLENAPDTGAATGHGKPIRIELDDLMLEQKLRAAAAYAELRTEVERTLARFGSDAFRTEWLWPVDPADSYGWDPQRIPFYESYGAERVARGTYKHVVTFSQHVKPLADALSSHRPIGA